MGPVTQSDGHDEPRPIGELVPRFAAVVEDVAVRGEDPVRDPVLAHVLPDGLDRVQLLVIDDRQLASARELSGIKETTAIVREALNALIERESARRLARLGGSESDLVPVPRR